MRSISRTASPVTVYTSASLLSRPQTQDGWPDSISADWLDNCTWRRTQPGCAWNHWNQMASRYFGMFQEGLHKHAGLRKLFAGYPRGRLHKGPADIVYIPQSTGAVLKAAAQLFHFGQHEWSVITRSMLIIATRTHTAYYHGLSTQTRPKFLRVIYSDKLRIAASEVSERHHRTLLMLHHFQDVVDDS